MCALICKKVFFIKIKLVRKVPVLLTTYMEPLICSALLNIYIVTLNVPTDVAILFSIVKLVISPVHFSIFIIVLLEIALVMTTFSTIKDVT